MANAGQQLHLLLNLQPINKLNKPIVSNFQATTSIENKMRAIKNIGIITLQGLTVQVPVRANAAVCK